MAECCRRPTGAMPWVATGPDHSSVVRSKISKSFSQYFPSPPPNTNIIFSITLAVWNYRIGASPRIIEGILKLSFSTPFLRSMKMTSERTWKPFHPPYIMI